MKKSLIFILSLTLLAGLAFNAQATYWPYDIPDLASYLSSASYSTYGEAIKGDYIVTALAYEAGWTIEYRDGNDATVFTNKTLADYGIPTLVEGVEDSYFKITAGGNSLSPLGTEFDIVNPASYLKVYQLDSSWSPPDLALTLSAGTIILGLDDGGAGPDCDYDDHILSFRPVPVPGAIWLFGAGLFGLVGFRRKLKN